MKRCVRICSASALLFSAMACFGQPQNTDDVPAKNVLKFRLALTLKQLGDEEFLVGDRTGADQSYAQAEKVISEVVSEPPEVLPSLIELLQTDSAYRRLLLKQGMSFWDSSMTFVIANPRQHLLKMKDYASNLQSLKGEIDGFINSNSSTKVTDLRALEQEVDTKFTVETIKEEKVDEIRDFNQTRVAQLKDRITYIQQKQQELAQDAAAASAALTRLENANTSIISNAVASQLNLKTDFGSALQKQWQSNIGSVAQSILSSNSPALLDGVKQFSSVAEQAVEAYQQAESIKNQVQQYSTFIEASKAHLRDPSVQGLLSIGSAVYSGLTPADRQNALTFVSQQKPLVALVGLTKSSDAARAAILRHLGGMQDFAQSLPTMIDSAINMQARDLSGWYAKELKNLYSRFGSDGAFSAKVMKATIRSFAADLARQLPPDALARVKAACNASTDTAIVSCLVDFDSHSLPFRIAANQHLVLDGTSLDLSLESLLSTAELVNAVPTQQLKNEAKAQLKQLIAGSEKISSFLQFSPDQLIDDQIKKYVASPNAAAAQKTFDQILNVAQGGEAQTIMKQLSELQIGSVALPSILGQHPDLPVTTGSARDAISKFVSGHPQNSVDPSGALLQSAISGALSYAVPGAGLAQAGVQLLSNCYAMDGQIRRIREANDQISKLTTEEIHLYDMVDESRLNVALAEYDRRIAQAGRKGALIQRGLYREELRTRAAQMSIDRAKALLRSQFFFYFAERIRQEYDALDRSLTLWGGDSRSPRRTLAELIQSDSSYVRLALDPQINLFEWLDRSNEVKRDDLETIVDHWQKVTQLASDICDQFACGISTSTTDAEIQSFTVKLSSIASADWAGFRQWQNQNSGQTFDLWFLIHPGQHLIPETNYDQRIVDVRLGAQQRDGTVVRLQNFTLVHPGVSYIVLPDQILKDVQAPKSTTSVTAPVVLDPNLLKKRWLNQTSYDDRFEGYGVFTIWHLTLGRDQINTTLDELTLQITYQYRAIQPIPTSPLVNQVLNAGFQGTKVSISPEFLRTIGKNNSDVAAKLHRWRTKQDPDSIPVLSFDPQLRPQQ